MPNDVSANQAYTLPHPDNVARDDASRIRDALNAIDADVSGALASILTLATIAYVDQRFTDLTGAAPAALDTLVELASALADDANFAAAMTTALAGKSDTGHGHAIADVASLQTTLDGKALSAHTHGTAEIVNSAVTLAKLANGTDGNLVGFGTAGAPQEVSPGTIIGRDLTVNASPPSGGADGDVWLETA